MGVEVSVGVEGKGLSPRQLIGTAQFSQQEWEFSLFCEFCNDQSKKTGATLQTIGRSGKANRVFTNSGYSYLFTSQAEK